MQYNQSILIKSLILFRLDIQINKVDCVVQKSKLTSNQIAERIQQYYKVNHIDTFSYSRPFHRGPKDPENEFATLWTEKTTLKTVRSLPGDEILLVCGSESPSPLMVPDAVPPLYWLKALLRFRHFAKTHSNIRL